MEKDTLTSSGRRLRAVESAPGFRPKMAKGNWAGTKRYLNVVRPPSADGGPSGNPPDLPIFSELPDDQILEAFVAAVYALTGCRIP